MDSHTAYAIALRSMAFRLQAAEAALDIARDALRKADSAMMTLQQRYSTAIARRDA